MIVISSSIQIPDEDLEFEFMHSSGPGGQNVNKVATAVRLRFDLNKTRALPDHVKSRLFKLAGKKVSKSGELLITARRHRRQERNRQEAEEKLITLVQSALEVPRPYRKTKVPLGSKIKRLETKKRRSQQKQLRRTLAAPDS